MTREEKLYSMTMTNLLVVADKLGVKINKKAAKSKAVEIILAAEEMNKQNEKELEKEEKELKKIVEEAKKSVEKPVEKTKQTEPSAPKRGALLEYNGKSQNICAWAKELGKSANTLYGRIYRLGWSIEDAFTK